VIRLIEVECRVLSAYLDQPVDYLKIDIEGSELAVLGEVGDKLANVRNLFCEYHHTPKQGTHGLARLLEILGAQGFEVHLGLTPWAERIMQRRPVEAVGRPMSFSVFAVNQRFLV
jgi:hypothetical protein